MTKEKKQLVFILKGLPASGKSTYAKKVIAEGNNKWKRVNKDDLRTMVDAGRWSKSREKFILKIRDQLISTYLEEGYNVIVDDTNLHPRHETRIKQLVGDRAEVRVISFHVPLKECLRRDCHRRTTVGPRVILSMYNQFLNDGEKIKLKDLPYNPYFLRYKDRSWFTTHPRKRKAIMYDIDGTLAHMWNRSPFQLEKVHEDYLNLPVAQMAKMTAQHYDNIILTGRSGTDDCREKTLRWLAHHQIPYTEFFMRGADDNRNDALIKEEIYKKHIEPYFDVIAIFDDRDRVVDNWRKLGLTCFQVDYGNF